MSTKIKRALFLLLAFAVLCAGCSRKEETAKEENPKIREQMALAEKYLGEQKFDEAIEALLEAVELDPEDVDVYLKLSEIYADQEMDMEAMDILEQGWEASQDEALRDRAAALGVRLGFLSEYAAIPSPAYAHTLVVNYAGLSPAALPEAMDLLAEIFGA